jgi:hypothetical protein
VAAEKKQLLNNKVQILQPRQACLSRFFVAKNLENWLNKNLAFFPCPFPCPAKKALNAWFSPPTLGLRPALPEVFSPDLLCGVFYGGGAVVC